MTSPLRRLLTRFTSATTAAGLLMLGAPAVLEDATPKPARSQESAHGLTPVSHRAEHPHRKIKLYRVRPGDTPSGIAVRYHAWTDQLMRINHLERPSMLRAGEVIRIPVVVERARACRKHAHHRSNVRTGKPDGKPAGKSAGKHQGKHQSKPDGKRHDKPKSKPKNKPKSRADDKPGKDRPAKHHAHRHPDHGWVHAQASRDEVRRMIVRRAKQRGVNPDLALAVAWMESGWQQKRISSAGALGAMQVLPGTGVWMSQYAGRRLNLRNLHDNVTAGVMLLRILRDNARPRVAVAGYYQGLAGVRRHGMYRSTKRYVANVMALRDRIDRGWSPV